MKLHRRDRSKRIVVVSLVSSCLLVSVFLFEGHTTPKQKNHDENADAGKLKVTIAPDKTKIKAGDSLVLRVRIYNEGLQSVYVATSFDGPENALSRLTVTLFRDGTLVDSGGAQRSAADYGRYRPEDLKEHPLANEFSKYWLVLRPGYAYEGQLILDSATFQTLTNPGKYEVRGTYRASGFMSGGINNPLAAYIAELGEMPYRAWTGELETNRVLIEVGDRTH
jgi:hypothetical protein